MATYFRYPKKQITSFVGVEFWQETEKMQVIKYIDIDFLEKLNLGIVFRKAGLNKSLGYAGKYYIQHKVVEIVADSTLNPEELNRTVRHELLHACQYASLEAYSQIYKLAQSSSYWQKAVELCQDYSVGFREIEYPVWALQHEEATCNYFIKKYLLK